MHRLRIPMYGFFFAIAAMQLFGLTGAVVDIVQGRLQADVQQIALLALLTLWIPVFILCGLAIDWHAMSRRPRPWSGGILAAFGVALAYFSFPSPSYVSFTLVGTVAAVALVFNPIPQCVIAAVLTFAAAAGLVQRDRGALAPGSVFVGLLAVAVSLTIRHLSLEYRRQGALFDQARWAASKLPTVILRLDSTIRQERTEAVLGERRRVARSVHDTVGYSLTALIAQLTSVQNMVSDAEARNKLRDLEEISRSLLRETRQLVTNIREDMSEQEEEWTERWRRTCEAFQDCTGVRINLRTEGLPVVPEALGANIHFIIQEGLTNAYRHGHAGSVAVTLLRLPGSRLLLMKISDDGEGADSVSPGSGLTGIRERVEHMGGTALWKTQPRRGFDLALDLPLVEEA